MNIPLCVDLDGTLIKTDSLYESFLVLVKKNPLYLFSVLFWLTKGIAYLKYKISEKVNLNFAILPYSAHFLGYLKEEYSKGRKLVLVTAASEKIATTVSAHLGIFSAVLASDETINLKGASKQQTLNKMFGEKQYDYAGNDKSDLKVWSSARNAILVNANAKLVRSAESKLTVEKIFPPEKSRVIAFLKAIRPHQDVKNLLVFVPLFLGHLFFNWNAVLHSCLAFASFCLLASSVYLTNDLLDLESDRQHRTKHKRPFAAGDLSIKSGIILAITFACAAMLIASYLGQSCMLVLVGYYSITMVYSFYLKRKILVDVFVLAILYTLRIIAGIAALQSDYSEWLITFSLFFFLSLAFVKRYSELYFLKKDNKTLSHGRGYIVDDLNQLSLFGTVSGYVATLVFAFYINSAKVIMLYRHPQWLWLVCLLMLYWISRIWMLATRGQIHEDPVVFALEDRTSLIAMFAMLCTMLIASI